MMDKDKNASRGYPCSCELDNLSEFHMLTLSSLRSAFFALTVTFEEFQEGSKADPTIISALTLVSKTSAAILLGRMSLHPPPLCPSIVRWSRLKNCQAPHWPGALVPFACSLLLAAGHMQLRW